MASSKERVGLALSGGGLRATFFHLGVIRKLREIGLLEKITDIASVSGGSILAAHLVLRWEKYTSHRAETFDKVQREILDLAKRDIRNRVLRRAPLQYMMVLPRLTASRRWCTSGLLENEYRETLFRKNETLSDLDQTGTGGPHLSILSTSLTTGQIVAFCSDGVCFHPQPEPGNPVFSRETATIRIARAVAASSAFPPMFCPVLLEAREIGFTEANGVDHRLTDGGIFDNVGVVWLTKGSQIIANKPPFSLLIVSNAGRPFDHRPSAKHTFNQVILRNMRANDISSNRLADYDTAAIVQRSAMVPPATTSSPSATVSDETGILYVRLGDRYNRTDPRWLSPQQQLQVETTRTDLNRFDPALVDLIIRHGENLTQDKLDALFEA